MHRHISSLKIHADVSKFSVNPFRNNIQKESSIDIKEKQDIIREKSKLGFQKSHEGK